MPKLFEVGKRYNAVFRKMASDEHFDTTGEMYITKTIVVEILKRTAKAAFTMRLQLMPCGFSRPTTG